MVKCNYAEFYNLFNVVLNVVMLSVIMLSVVMLSVVMLSVVAPIKCDLKIFIVKPTLNI
jgi:hypothetical protein